MEGKTIYSFTLQRLLGVGGMAEVWYAENEIHKKAAVKILNMELSHNTNIVERFRSEADIMVKLNHPNIRQVYDYGTIDGRPAIVMEYLEGDDLKARLKQGQRFTDVELRRWWDQLASALNYTHQKGIVHRDIKPGNIFVDTEGNIKLLDFGIAKVKESISMTQTGALMGTLMYMSPEQVRDSKHIGPESDAYSLAVSFVHLITGKRPYDSDTTSDYDIRKGIVEIPLDLTGVPADWQAFLRPYLEKDPAKRPALRPFEAVQMAKEPQTLVEKPKPLEKKPEPVKSIEDEGTIVSGANEPEPKLVVKPELIEERPVPKKEEKKKGKKGLWIGFGLIVILALVFVFALGSGKKGNGVLKIIVDIPRQEILKNLAGSNASDSAFQKALNIAYKRNLNETKSFVSLFGKAYEEINPDGKLASVFLYELKDRGITVNSTNAEVLKVLSEECEMVDDRCISILNARLHQVCKEEGNLFNKVNFDMDKKNDGRIIIQFHNFSEGDEIIGRIRRMIRNQGCLEFYETYTMQEIGDYLVQANAKYGMNYYDTTFVSESAYSLFSKLQLIGLDNSAVVGVAQVKDMSDVDQMLEETAHLFPRNLKFAWMAGEGEYHSLVALKKSYEGNGVLDGSLIEKASVEITKQHGLEVTIEMNREGAMAWKRISGNNIGRQIAIVMDGWVYACPEVKDVITNGIASISMSGNPEAEVRDMTIILNSGMMPVQLEYLQESME